MKKILVPTDFSENASSAIDYAVELAKAGNAQIILFNVYNFPVMPAEIPIALPLEDKEKSVMNSLKALKDNIHLRAGSGLVIKCECRFGFPVEEINLFVAEHQVDLIVMGMEGGDYLTEKLIGNITTSLLKKAPCAVLVIDKHIKFHPIKNIALACDYSKINYKETLAPLNELAQRYGSQVYILNVVADMKNITNVSKAVSGVKLDHALEHINHSFHYIQDEDVVEGINNFVSDNKIDLVVMIPRTHSALQNLFHSPNSRRMAFHTKAALLCLHEQ